MAADSWLSATLGAVGEFRNGVNFNRHQEGSGLPVLKVKDFENRVFVPEVGFDELDPTRIDIPENQLLEPGDTVIIRSNGNSALVGRSLYYRGGEQRLTFSGFCIRFRPNRVLIDPQFAGYLIRSPRFRQRFSAFGSGTGIQNLSQGILAAVPVHLPPVEEQRRIAAVLGTLDDKIDLNRRMNETLEAMARAIFKSWFVDFDPVRAKAAGRQPAGMDAETAALFPSAFEDSPLGAIPRGWRVGAVHEEFNVLMGQSPPGETYNENGDGIVFFQGRRDFCFRFPANRVFCTAPTRLAKAGDTLVSVRAPVGDLNMAAEACAIGRGLAAVRHKSGTVSYTYHAMHFMSEDFARFEAGGTVFGCMNKDDLRGIRHVVASPAVIQAFEELVFPLDQRLALNERESMSLATIRDALLPKLLSGEIRVKHAEHMAEAAG